MEALQYIYTSWKNGDSTDKGYMIYSRSEGITEEECGVIKDAMQYLAPKELPLSPTPQEIADLFPYSFSYFVLPTGRGCVAQSTYLGRDYSGRFGNYIIYALVFDIDDLPCRPAELFAEPYIKTSMTQEELDAPSPVPPLPPLEITEYASVINDEQLTEFLFDKEDEFAQLISMILAARDEGVPFYLNDTRENLVLWSAAVERILPSRLAKRFCFNTYIGDHESMRTQKARDKGLNFHLIGVRPDANYFNYATESKSNRQIVMDFIGGNMTEGIIPGSFAQAMAASMTFDCEEVDSFGEFVDSTSINEINGKLQDAFLYYHLLKNDEFEYSDNNLRAVLSFGTEYCSESDNSDIGSKLLVKYQEGGWSPEPDLFIEFWKFVCSYSSFMIFTMFELFTETMYQYADETSGSCEKPEKLLKAIQSETPQQYSEYLNYLNSSTSVEQMLLYLSGHKNKYTNSFYINWLVKSYPFSGGLTNDQAVSKLLRALLKNITLISGCDVMILEILLSVTDNPPLFRDILSGTVNSLQDPQMMCSKYAELSESLTERQINRFEQYLLETPDAVSIAAKMCARRIGTSKEPVNDFWRFYDNHHSRLLSNSELSLDPIILACVNNADEKSRESLVIDILQRVDSSLINDSETITVLTGIANSCSVKTLAKMDSDFLQKICELRAKVDKTGMEKIMAVYVGEMLVSSNSQHKRTGNIFEELVKMGITLKKFEKSDYENYIKNYFGDYIILIQATEDVSAVATIFYNPTCFNSFSDNYISALKKAEKKDPDRWRRVIGWTCVYLVKAERSDRAAEELYRPVIRYLRTLNDYEQMDVQKEMAKSIPISRCDAFFEEAHRKEGLGEKLGNLFHKK